LKDQLKQEEDNLSTAYTRNKMVETKDSAVSFHQTWGFLERPLKKRSIPILIVLSVILAIAIVVGIYLLVTMTATVTEGGNIVNNGSGFTDKIKGIFSKNSV
jgi:predicted PurR-regulated permease PerM